MGEAQLSTGQLWELLGDRLRSFLGAHVGDPEATEDLLQETFVRIHAGLEGLTDESRIEAWVFQIARNLLVDHRRSRSPTGEEHDPDAPVAITGVDAGDLHGVVAGWLPTMIDQLPEPDGQAVRLYELEGLSQKEISERLGISLSGAKSRIQRGRERLKAALFACCSFERDRRGNVIGFDRNDPGGCPRCD